MKSKSRPLSGRIAAAHTLSRRTSSAAVFLALSFLGLGSAQAGTTVLTPVSGDMTSTINTAIQNANTAGGGVVEFPSGSYLTGSIELLSNVTLQLDSGATILGNNA